MDNIISLTECFRKHRAQLKEQTEANFDGQLKPTGILTKEYLIDRKIKTLMDKEAENIQKVVIINEMQNSDNFHTKSSFRKTLCQNQILWNDKNFWENLPNPKHTINKKKEIKQSQNALHTEPVIKLQLELEIVPQQAAKIEEILEIKPIQPEQIPNLTNILEYEECSEKQGDETHSKNIQKEIPVPKETNLSTLQLANSLNSNKGTTEPDVQNDECDTKKWNSNQILTKLNKGKQNNDITTKIDEFVENIKKFQEQSGAKDEKRKQIIESRVKKEKPLTSFENRFRAQKSIIEQQKVLLEEQKRMIEGLKLNKIQEEAKKSLENAVREYRKIATESSQMKHKAKPVNEELTLSLQPSKLPKVLQQMETRAREREEKRLLIKERKRLLDEERKRLAEEAVQRKLKEENEEKEKRLQHLKEQREAVRQMELEKQMERKRMNELYKRGEQHRTRKLKKHVLEVLQLAVQRIDIRMQVAGDFHDHNVLMKHFSGWRSTAAEIVEARTAKADRLFRNRSLSKCLKIWKEMHLDFVLSYQVAVDRHEMALQLKTITAWHKLVCQYHIEYQINLEKAKKHHRKFLLFQCFHYWRTFPAIMQIEKVRNERKKKWRLRVAEILPDYNPEKSFD